MQSANYRNMAADFTTLRAMDDFFINPTNKMDEKDNHLRSSTPFENPMPVTPPSELFTIKPGKKTPEPSATIKDFIDEPIFWRGYTSDEEVASPIDNDDYSFHSRSSSDDFAGALDEASISDYHAQTCDNAQQPCSQAQTVQLVSAGKAKVVSMPKLVDVSSAKKIEKPLSCCTIRPPLPKMNKTTISGCDIRTKVSLSASSLSSGHCSPASPPPSSSVEQTSRKKIVRRKANVLRFQAGSCSGSSQSTNSRPKTPPQAQRAVPLEHDRFPSYAPSPSSVSHSPVRRRMPKLSSSFSLRGLGRGMRRSNESDDGTREDVELSKQTQPTVTSPRAPNVDLRPRMAGSSKPAAMPPEMSDMFISSITASKPMMKMIPRGADERAPPIVLPPCPDDYSDDDEVFTAQWPPRKDSIPSVGPVDTGTRTPTIQRRRRSLSAAVVTAQA